MSGLTPSALTPLFVVVTFLVLLSVRRTYAIATGTPYSESRLFGYLVVWVAIFAFFAGSTIDAAWVAWGNAAFVLLAPYAAVVVLSALAAVPRVQRLVVFERRADGQVYFRLPAFVPAISTVLFLVRLVVGDLLIFGLTTLTSFAPPTNLSTGSLLTLIAFDLLYGGSVGLLVGRSLGVRKGYLALGDKPLASA